MFLEAARVLADSVGERDLNGGTLYPRQSGIRQVSLEIAIAVANEAYEQNLATLARPKDLAQMIKDQRSCLSATS